MKDGRTSAEGTDAVRVTLLLGSRGFNGPSDREWLFPACQVRGLALWQGPLELSGGVMANHPPVRGNVEPGCADRSGSKGARARPHHSIPVSGWSQAPTPGTHLLGLSGAVRGRPGHPRGGPGYLGHGELAAQAVARGLVLGDHGDDERLLPGESSISARLPTQAQALGGRLSRARQFCSIVSAVPARAWPSPRIETMARRRASGSSSPSPFPVDALRDEHTGYPIGASTGR